MKAAVMIIVLFLLLFFSTAHAQHNWFDSVKHVAAIQKNDTNKVWTLVTLCDAYAFNYPDTAFIYGKQANDLAEKLDFDNGRLYSIISLNAALYCMGKYSLELDYAFKLLPLSKRMKDINATGFSFGAVGDSYLNLGEPAMAMKYYKEVLKLGIREKLPELHRMYSMLAPVFIQLHEYDSALYYAKKGLSLFKASVYYASNDWNMRWSQSCAYTTLGEAFQGKNIYDSALYYYRLSIPVSETLNMRINKIIAYNGMASVFNQQHNFDSAKLYAQKVLFETSSVMSPSEKQKAADLLAAMYEQQHNADSSLKYLHIAIQIKDSLYNHEKMMAFQNVLFKQNEKEHAIETATTALQNRYRLYFIIAGLMVVFVVSFILIRNKRQKQLQNIRNGIADDLHDDIGSALSSINIMSELAKQKSPEAAPLLTSIGESTTAMQENMSDIVWMLKSGNDRFENVLQRMNLFASEILEAKNITLDFANTELLPALKLTMEQRKNFYLFFKEAINNAAKYSDAERVSVCIAQKDHNVEMNISDDGKGFDTTKIFNGNGMSSLKKRAAELNADFKITSCINKGTDVQLKFKIT
jgi:two-component system, NarL family, sensor histidine kinase UhpB